MAIASEKAISLGKELEGVILEELNVKSLRYLQSAQSLVSYSLKPQLKTLGPKYGKKLKAIAEFLSTCNAGEVVEAVKNGGSYALDLDGEVILNEEDLQIFTGSAQGYVSASDFGITVALNTALTEEIGRASCRDRVYVSV